MKHKPYGVPWTVDLLRDIHGAGEFDGQSLDGTMCWMWGGSRDTKGRAMVRNGKNLRSAYKVAWIALFGYDPSERKGIEACHICRGATKGCWNPHHVIWGSRKFNAENKVRDGTVPYGKTGVKGSAHYASKITEDDVRAIRKDTRKLKEIGADYGLAIGTVSQIRSGQRWRHV